MMHPHIWVHFVVLLFRCSKIVHRHKNKIFPTALTSKDQNAMQLQGMLHFTFYSESLRNQFLSGGPVCYGCDAKVNIKDFHSMENHQSLVLLLLALSLSVYC